MFRTLLILVIVIAAWPLRANEAQVPKSQTQLTLSFVPLVKTASPAVVNIYAKVIASPRNTPLQRDPFFERFFRDPEMERPRIQNSLGSGVILSSDGIVVSNYHVVGNATDIRVALADRREFAARVLLADAVSDLAILKIDVPEPLPFVPLRRSDTVEVGELALAIGNPFGVGKTVSSGIISGLARSGGPGGGGRGYFIQTDAPINPGNSGGALIDMSGRLVGINTSILTRSGGSNGIGFAIPSDLVAAFVTQARGGSRVFVRPWAGMSGQPVDADLASSLGLLRPEGMIVSNLHPASPFFAAGIVIGDIISAVNGQPINTPSEMVYRMSVIGIGQSVPIERHRGGDTKVVEVGLIAAPDVPAREMRIVPDDAVLAGLEVVRINPMVIVGFNLPLESEGVMVTRTGEIAARVGLRAGDRLLEINGVSIAHPDDVLAAVAAGGRSFAISAERGTQRIMLRFRI